jgi:hypothetical protein
VPLTKDQPDLTVKDDILVQGCAKDKVAQNAGLELLIIAGVDQVAIIHTQDNGIAYHIGDNDDGIITVADILLAHSQNDTIILEGDAEDDGAD